MSIADSTGAALGSIELTTLASGSVTGSAFTGHPVVTIKDTSNATMSSNSSTIVTASVSSGGTLIGTKSITASNGVATFSDLGLNGINGTNYVITFKAAGYSVSQTIAAATGAANKLELSIPGVGGKSGVAFTTQPVVRVLDAAGNLVTSGSYRIDANVPNTQSECGQLSNVYANSSSGIASFTNMVVSGTANYDCVITYSATGLVSVSNTVTLSAGNPDHLVIVTHPGGTDRQVSYGEVMGIQPVYQIVDAMGNILNYDNTTQLTISGAAGYESALFANATATAVNGRFTLRRHGYCYRSR